MVQKITIPSLSEFKASGQRASARADWYNGLISHGEMIERLTVLEEADGLPTSIPGDLSAIAYKKGTEHRND